ncbi:MAG: type I pullulanase [Bacillota bacterium]
MARETSPVVAVGGQEMFELFYPGDDLGAVYTKESTTFRVFAPTALGVSVALYSSADAAVCYGIEMAPDCDGTWLATVPGDLAGMCYMYRVDLGGAVNEAVDPYARALTANGVRGVIVDLDATNPEGWERDVRPPFAAPTDAIIYEAHVRDFTISPDANVRYPGKYLGMAARGCKGPGGISVGLDHLVELGVTHVHLMPIQDFASVDELDKDDYNWGYDPYHFFVPEGSYSIAPECAVARIIEVKKMVQSLHSAGLRVILDVVYNHTWSVENSPLHMIVPSYYHRTDCAGRYTNGSGCGNELATDRPMVRKLILDSLRYWVEEYHVDGFRFDLMGLMDYDTVREIESRLYAVEPSLLLYGEPWAGGLSGLPSHRMFTKGRQRGLRIGVFNDGFRNAIKGDNDGVRRGFATGAGGLEHAIRKGVVGAIPYSADIADFAAEPGECINYVSCHDNLTLWDKIARSAPFDSEEDRIKMDMLAQAIAVTSQGVPFIEGGAEMLRTKGGHRNSYRSGDSVNQFDWARKLEYAEVTSYYKGLIKLRRAHPAFRMKSADEIRRCLRFLPTPTCNVVAFMLDGASCGDKWDEIVVIHNPNRYDVTIDLPTREGWNVVVGGTEAGVEPLDHDLFGLSTYEGGASVVAKAMSTTILHT